MLEALTSFSLDQELMDQWTSLTKARDLHPKRRINNNLLQHVLENIEPMILEKINETTCAAAHCVDIPAISKDEEQVIYYVSGFIQRKLVQKFNKRKENNKAAQFYFHIVKEWADLDSENCQQVPESVQAWVDSIDRGGLIRVNNNLYCFMREVELCARPMLFVNFERFRHVELVSSIVGELKSTDSVVSAWRDLIGDVIDCDDVSEGLLDEVLKCWVSACGRQRVKDYIFHASDKVARMGTPAFRKTLDKF